MTVNTPARAATLYVPVTLARWPWPRSINPHYLAVKEEADAWLCELDVFSPKSQEAVLKCNFALLCALAYPLATKEELRITCDMMHVFVIIDEYTDVEGPASVRQIVDTIADALEDPHKPRPTGENNLGKVVQQFWSRAIKHSTHQAQKHFITNATEFLKAIIIQATDRESEVARNVDDFMVLRRASVGAGNLFFGYEMTLNLPDEVYFHPIIDKLHEYCADMIAIDNDIHSYNREQSTGDEGHNLITVAMREHGLDRGGAMAWAANYHAELQAKFIVGLEQVPVFGEPLDSQLRQYLNGVANSVRAQQSWGYESMRYFGAKGQKVRESRLVPLLPKARVNHALCAEQVVVADLDVAA